MSSESVQDPRRIDPALRAKYDVRGPRYTSYPPATHFHALDPNEVLKRFRDRNRLEEDPGLSLYFHIPFCRSRCLFCGCHTFIKTATTTEAYLDALVAEMNLAARWVDPKRTVHQVALGGGTPNFLEREQINRLAMEMEALWNIHPRAELSVEIDPRTSKPEKLQVLLEHGFNRYSLGVQDFDPLVLDRVRRGQDDMQVEEVVSFLRKRGIQDINFDLIYGLPGQSLPGAAETAGRVIELRPSRIALYSYAHVPWIRPHQKALEKYGLPSSELKASLFLSMMDAFLQAGYVSVGMDHFALPEDPLAQALDKRTLRRNFMGYTTGRGLDLLAFGVSAISSVGTAYSQNDKDLNGYLHAVGQGRLPIEKGFLLSREDQLRRELIMELFCNFFVDLDSLSERFHMDLAVYLVSDLEGMKNMRDDGLVDWNPHCIQVTEAGRFFIRNICMTFDGYLEQDPKNRMYSRTV